MQVRQAQDEARCFGVLRGLISKGKKNFWLVRDRIKSGKVNFASCLRMKVEHFSTGSGAVPARTFHLITKQGSKGWDVFLNKKTEICWNSLLGIFLRKE